MGVAGAGTAGGEVIVGPLPGQHGAACIPGGTSVEANGSPAETAVTTLDRCDNGLACDTTNHCTGIPNCPQSSGICVVHGVPLDSAGTGGTSGNGGAFSAGGYVASVPGGAPVATVAPEVGVTAMAADDTRLYWIDYGTRDALGNYQQDGALLSYGFADAKTTTVASDLPGPDALGVTSGHAYVAVDGGPLIGSPVRAQLLRLPLAGGAQELVQDPVTPTSFAANGDQAFWSTSSGVYSATATGDVTLAHLFNSCAGGLQADATDLYGSDCSNSIFRFTLAGSAPSAGATETQTSVVSPNYPYALGGDLVYGVESGLGLILDQAPKTGGVWNRKRALGEGGRPDRVQIVGDRYFVSATTTASGYTKAEIVTGLISSAAPPVRLLEMSLAAFGGALGQYCTDVDCLPLVWVGSATTLFWTDGSAVFSRPIADK
jgi:hypothetical protein